MRNVGLAGDGYMNFKDIIHGLRKEKGLRTWEDLKPLVCEAQCGNLVMMIN
jgi:hypothetical protein